MGRGTLPEVRVSSKDPQSGPGWVRDPPGDPGWVGELLEGTGRVGGPSGRSGTSPRTLSKVLDRSGEPPGGPGRV